MRGIRLYAIVAAAFMAGAFSASPELRAYAANTVGSADIINNSILSADIKDGEVKTVDLGGNAITSAKIKDGEVKTDDIAPGAIGSLRIKDNDVKAHDIAPDSVGASEIIGVSKLIFARCHPTVPGLPAGGFHSVDCNVKGAASGDEVVAVSNINHICHKIVNAFPFGTDHVRLFFRNDCATSSSTANGIASIIVFKT